MKFVAQRSLKNWGLHHMEDIQALYAQIYAGTDWNGPSPDDRYGVQKSDN